MPSPTTSAGTPQSPATKTSDPDVAEVILLHCGHGDTILLRLPPDRWILIDCHLPAGEVRQRFFDLVEQRGINRLVAIFLSHPDSDHFHGMLDVVRHFSQPGRGIKFFGDSGITSKDIAHAFFAAGHPDADEYAELQAELTTLFKKRALTYLRADEHSRTPIRRLHDRTTYRLIPVGPDSTHVRALLQSTLDRLSRGAANAFSLVLVLQAVCDPPHPARPFTMLLSGDAERNGIESALGAWRRHEERVGDALGFAAVKVPHHGSKHNHSPNLSAAAAGHPDPVAVVTVGDRFRALPSRAVLQSFKDNGWKVLLTTKRVVPPPGADTPLTLAGRLSAAKPYDCQCQSIWITWNPKDTVMNWGPPTALLDDAELDLYT